MNSKIHKLLEFPIEWKPDSTNEYFICHEYENAKLIINDFPDQCMYSLLFEGEKYDFDDKPKYWKIQFK